jgi:hypothetical protein
MDIETPKCPSKIKNFVSNWLSIGFRMFGATFLPPFETSQIPLKTVNYNETKDFVASWFFEESYSTASPQA